MTEPITATELAAIRERCGKATLKQWSYRNGVIVAGNINDPVQYRVAGGAIYGDGEFIAHARTDVPRLLAEVERLRAWLEFVRDDCDIHHLAAFVDAALSGEQPPQ